MMMQMIDAKSAVIIEVSGEEQGLAEYLLNKLNELCDVSVSVTAEVDGTVRIVISRRSYGVALDLMDGLYSPDPQVARKLVGMYNLIHRVMEEDVQKTDVKPILKLIQGGKEDE